MKKMLCILLALVLFISTSSTVLASEQEGVLPSGISYSKIEGVMDAYVNRHSNTTAAMSVAVFRDRDVIMEKAFGYSDKENRIKNEKDTVFEWGSITKLLTWTSVMQLAEKGKINLNGDIRAYLPKGFFKKLKYDTPITMINLMNHNAGWQETVTDLFIKNKKDVKELGEALKLIEPEQIHEPGRIVAYSNWGVALAGYIVERVSGQSFDNYVHKHIFEPLGMKHTAINPTLSDNKWVAGKRAREKCYTVENRSLGSCQYYISLYPAGRAIGTLSDFIKFAQVFLAGKGEESPLFEKRKTLDEMLSPSLYFSDGKTVRNYHGFWTDELSVPLLWHNGGTIGNSSWFAFDPKSGTGMVVFTNQSNEAIYNCGLLPLVFGEYMESPGNKSTEDISGTYVLSQTCFEGYAKPYSLACLMGLDSKGNGKFEVSGTHNTVASIGENSYLYDMGGMKQFVIYASKDRNGQIILQLPGKDYIKVNGYGVIAEFSLLLIFVLSALYALFALIVSFIKLLKHENSQGVMGKYRAGINLSVIIAAVIFAYISVKLFSGLALFNEVQWGVMLNGLLSLLPVVYNIILVSKWRKLNCSSKEKIKFIMTGAAGLIMTINIIFWQSYKFW